MNTTVSQRRWWFAYCTLEEVGAYLEEGWEPFAVDARGSGIGAGRYVTVYLRAPVDALKPPVEGPHVAELKRRRRNGQ